MFPPRQVHRIIHENLHIDVEFTRRPPTRPPLLDLRLKPRYREPGRLIDLTHRFPGEMQNRTAMDHVHKNLEGLLKGIPLYKGGATRVNVTTGGSLRDLAKVRVEYP